jgi:hypothetical protein
MKIYQLVQKLFSGGDTQTDGQTSRTMTSQVTLSFLRKVCETGDLISLLSFLESSLKSINIFLTTYDTSTLYNAPI